MPMQDIASRVNNDDRMATDVFLCGHNYTSHATR